ncbi:MAG: hypothetical protein M3O71_20275 [Bacteroidota bacterium]|nr:hypothetical protein [Bacteroidota bacterium]
MTGTLAQLISLVSCGNEFLGSGEMPEKFYPENSVFRFCNGVKFVAFRKKLFSSEFKEVEIADDPYKWFKLLKKEKCKVLRVFYESSKDQTKGPDHKLAGFVGGGGTWLIEAIFNKHSDFYANNWTVTDKDAADKRIWSIKYGNTAWDQPIADQQFDLLETKNELADALLMITAFANKQKLDNWVDVFNRAQKALESDEPSAGFYHTDLVVTENYSLAARQVLFAAGLAWVFGGMGSWNDLGFDTEEENKTYDELSAALYAAINKGVVAAINSYS